jgi:diguanylate cyclase (GGDEF)-like protein
MGGWFPTTGSALLPGGLRHAVRRPTPPSRAWLLVAAVLLVALAPVVAASPQAALRALAWVAMPLLAAVAWARVGRRTWGRPRASFLVMASAAGVAAAAQVHAVYAGYVLTAPGPAEIVPGAWYGLLGIPVLIALGAALTLAPVRGGAPGPALVVDSLILLLVGTVVGLRLVIEPLLRLEMGPGALLVGASQQGLVIVPAVVACLVVLRRGSALAPRSAVLLLAATLALGAWSISHQVPLPARPAGVAFVLWSIGWLLFASSGFTARTVGSTRQGMLARRRFRDGLRRLLVPGAALFLAVAVLDIAFGASPWPGTVVAVALLAAMVAVRTAHAFSLTDREADQRRRLAHTQALVSVTHSLAGTTDLDATLGLISEAARSVLGAGGAGIELVTEDGRNLETRSAVGMPEQILGMHFPLEGSFTGWVVRHGEPRATPDLSLDPYIHPNSRAVLGRWPVAAGPIRFRGETLGALFACIRADPFEAEELQLLGAMAEQAAIAIQNARLFEQVTVLSVTDPLTGLANRRQLEREVARDFAAARRGRDLAVVIFDLDDFKAYNDAHGHLAGDEALQAFATALREESRAMNLVARWGGDEFVALLSDADAAGAAVFVERVRRRFDGQVSGLGRSALTVSAGTAVYRPEMESPEALLREADDALYRVKPRVRT